MASAVLSGLTLAHSSYGAYTLTNTITASAANPYITTDNTGQSVNYSGISIANFTNPVVSNGPFNTALVGLVSGNFTTTNGTTLPSGVVTGDKGGTAYSAYFYNASGFQLVGQYTTTSNGSYGQPNVRGVDTAGQVLGGESRSASNSTQTGILGNEVWLSTPTSSTTSSDVYLGLFGPNNTYTASYADSNGFSTDTGTYSSQSPIGLTGGYAVGTSQRYAGDSTVGVGLISSQVLFHGTVIGNNIVSASSSLGQSAWIQTATTSSTEIGLMNASAGNSYTLIAPAALNGGTQTTIGTYYSNSVTGVNAAGDAFGTSQAYTPVNASTGVATTLGQDGYVWNGVSSTPVGPYTTGQTLSVPGYGGGTLSFNYYYTASAGGGVTPGTSQGRNTSLSLMNANGVVAGTASYYIPGTTSTTAQGTIAFSYNGTSYTQLGYTTNNFTSNAYPLPVGVTSFVNAGGSFYNGSMSSSVVAINKSGTIAGTSTTYVGQGNTSSGTSANYTETGSAAWSATPSGALTQIGLWNQGPSQVITQAPGTANAGYSATYNIHQNPSYFGTYIDTPSLMNANGLIAGVAQRYSSTGSSLGADAWVYDPAAGTTYAVDPTDESGTGYVFENIAYLSDSGVLVGEYKTSSSFSTPYTAFIWSDSAPTTSFTLLTGVNVNGLSTAGFQSLIEAYYGADAGAGPVYVSASTGTVSNTVNGLGTVVPEPTTLSLLAIGSLGLLGRRRKA